MDNPRQVPNDETLFELAGDAILLYDPETTVVLAANRRAAELYGFPREILIGKHLREDLAVEADQSGPFLPELLERGVAEAFEEVHRRADGSAMTVQFSAAIVPFRGRPAVLSITRDVTARKELEAQLTHQAFHDPLTDLPNRALYRDRLEHALVRAARNRRGVAVYFLDLDDFKGINDRFGHAGGDQALVVVAARLRDCLRPGDTAARFGGDEFLVLAEGVNDVRRAGTLAERIATHLGAPLSLVGEELRLTASIGIALSASPAVPAGELLRRADVAMYLAKTLGRNCYEIFDPGPGTSPDS